jgi:hypothetical protein
LENYSYLGCYEDGAEPLAVTYEFDNGMTPELCRNICSLASCPAFGIGGSFECHCGKSLEPFAVSADEKECTRACAGDERDICGGGKRLNVYSATVGFEGLGGGNGSTGASASSPSNSSGGGGNGGTNDGASGDSKDGSSSGSKSGSSGGTGDNNNNTNGDTKGGVTLSAGAIAGIAIGSAAVAAIISGVLACVFCFRKRNINNYTPPVMMAPTAIGGYQPDTPQQQPMQQYSNLGPVQQQGPHQYGFVKANENSPSYSTVSPASEAVGRSVSPLVAGGTALPPPGPPPGHSHEMAAAMAYEMPVSVNQK